MSIHKVYIVDVSTSQPVEAKLHDDLTPDALLDVEDQWIPAREQIRTKLNAARLAPQAWPESLHWDWGRKGLVLALKPDADSYRIMAIEYERVWQATMVTLSTQHLAITDKDIGKPLVYIDYLEVAPWNWQIDNFQNRKYTAGGSVLLRAAIEQSYAKGWAGRIGLHALPKALPFYQKNGLTFVKNDPQKQGLAYCELTASEASKRTQRSR